MKYYEKKLKVFFIFPPSFVIIFVSRSKRFPNIFSMMIHHYPPNGTQMTRLIMRKQANGGMLAIMKTGLMPFRLLVFH